jgi:hypothetical protein
VVFGRTEVNPGWSLLDTVVYEQDRLREEWSNLWKIQDICSECYRELVDSTDPSAARWREWLKSRRRAAQAQMSLITSDLMECKKLYDAEFDRIAQGQGLRRRPGF